MKPTTREQLECSKVYSSMNQISQYTFRELQELTQLKNIDLCMALIHLISEKKVEQNMNENGVYYTLADE